MELTAIRVNVSKPGDFLTLPWQIAPQSNLFVHSDGSGATKYRTYLQAAWDELFLYLHFFCQDDNVLATMENRDAPLYDEEVVEAFISSGSLGQYYEFNLSPNDVVFDSKITYEGIHRVGDPSWDCIGFRHGVVQQNPDGKVFGNWDGYLAIPFAELKINPKRGLALPANFYRIKRVGGDQYLAWTPTYARPANFHVPERFGRLVLA